MSTTVLYGTQMERREELAASSHATPGRGEDAAFHARIEALRPVLARTASAVLRRPDDVDDAVQETLLRLVRHGERIDPAKGNLEAWARTVARRVALDMLARLQPASAGALDPALPEHKTPLEAREIAGRLRAAIERLPDAQRAAFLLVHQEGLTHAEAAGELRISQESLRARLYRARLELRAMLKEWAP